MGNPMVLFTEAHSHVLALFGNQTYLTLIDVPKVLFTAIEVRSQPARGATITTAHEKHIFVGAVAVR